MKSIIEEVSKTEAIALGVVKISQVDSSWNENYKRWLDDKMAGRMNYLSNYPEIRQNPELLLPGAKSLLVLAFSYSQPELRKPELPLLSPYAYGADYHKALRKRLKNFLHFLSGLSTPQANCRICIDSAPIFERYWALKSGIATACDNSMLYIPGFGQEFFLVEILTTKSIPEFKWVREAQGCKTLKPVPSKCLHCNKCIDNCPSNALFGNGKINAGRCLNYLAIETHGVLTNSEKEIWNDARSKSKREFWTGCDICQRVCPLNNGVPSTTIHEFLPKPGILTLTPEIFHNLPEKEKEAFLAGSPLKRALSS